VKLTTHLLIVPRLRMRGPIPPLPQYIFVAWYLVKHRDNFAFSFINVTRKDERVNLYYKRFMACGQG